MKKPTEAHELQNICETIRAENNISDANIDKLAARFGQRTQKALDALNESRIKKYVFKPSERIVWIVVGKERDYLVMPSIDYCSCDDFYFQFDHGHVCYHIIAQKLAEATGRFDLFEDDDHLFNVLIREWKTLEERPPKKKTDDTEDTA